MNFSCPDCHELCDISSYTTHECPDRPLFRDYEYQVLRDYSQRYNAIAYPWAIVPTEMLLGSGYIKDIGATRRRRLSAAGYRDWGLDGLGLLPNGGYDGIQSKRWTAGTLSGEDLGTFSSAAICILMKNPRNGMVLYHAPGSRVCNDVMCSFDDVETMRVHEVEPELKQLTTQVSVSRQESTFKPTSSQEKALEFLAGQKHGLSLLAMPCGCGKTLVGGWHIATAGFSTVIIAAPLIASAEQGLRRLAAFLPDHKPVAFWSGSCSIDGITAFLDEDRLQHNLKARSKVLIGTTYDSAGKVLDALKTKRRNGAGTVVLMDEAHNIAPANNDPARSLAFGGGKLRKTILATATPPKSMMKELFDGEDIPTFKYNMREAIANKEIADYTITVPLVQDKNFRPVELAALEQQDDEWDAMGRAIFHAGAMHHDGARRSIVYCYSIAQCEAYEAAFQQVCKEYLGVECWAGRITCDQSAGPRASLLKAFQKPTKLVRLHILTSIRILDEAIDVPSCDSVFFTDVSSRISERSWLRAVQRLSRATRLDPDNPHKVARGYVWADLEDNDNVANLLHTLQQNDSEVATRVRVHSSRYDVAVGNKEITQLCHLELEEWQERFKMSTVTPRDLIELKVQWICAQASRPQETLKASLTLLDGRIVEFFPGRWLYSIKPNWLDRTEAKTVLTAQQMNKLEADCVWLPALVARWQTAEAEGVYEVSVDEKISLMLQHYAHSRPTSNAVLKVTLQGGQTYQFPAGIFLNNVRRNWLAEGTRHTHLTQEQKSQLEDGCEWFSQIVEHWRTLAASKTYRPTLQEQVAWTMEFFAKARPAQKAKQSVMLPNGDMFDFLAGSFVDRILSNWIEDRKTTAHLTDEQKGALEAKCIWLPEVIKKMSAKPTYSPNVQQRVDWLVQHYAEERPIGQPIAKVTGPEGQPHDFPVGRFLSNISQNFVQGARPNTRLTADQITYLRTSCKWFAAAELTWRAAAANNVFKPATDQKISWFIEHNAGHKPKQKDQVSIKLSDSTIYTFPAGRFWANIRPNFIFGKKPNTLLSADQIRCLKNKVPWIDKEHQSSQDISGEASAEN